MAKTLEQLIGQGTLTELIQDPKGGIPDLFLPPGFKTIREEVDGNVAEWDAVEGNRQTAKLSLPGSPSRRVDLKGVTRRSATMIHTFEHTFHGADKILKLKSDDPRIQAQASRIVDNQVSAFRSRYTNLELAAIYKVLAAGTIYFDADGNLLPTSSGALYTVDFQIPANNKNQCNTLISATWATNTTPIISNIRALRAAAYKLTGLPLAHAFYGANVLADILINTQCLAAIGQNPGFTATAMQGTIPNGFGGIREWHPTIGGFFQDKDGTDQDIFPADYCVFTPDPSPDWWAIANGATPVPTALSITGDVNGALANIGKAYGMFSYATIETDPVAIKHFGGHKFLPLLKVPEAIFIADVEF